MSLHGLIFKELDLFWNNLRKFAFENKTIFEVFFIFLYFLEQFLLIKWSYDAKSLQELGFLISIFALIVLTTFSLHKLLMESRIKYLENKVAEADTRKRTLEEENKLIKDTYKDLFYGAEILISKDLNSEKISRNRIKER